MGSWKEIRESKKLQTFEKIISENFPNLMKELDIQIQEAQRVPKKMNPKRTTPRHIIIKMQKIKDKERILKGAWEKQSVTYKRAPVRLSAEFSTEALQSRKE